MIVDSREQMKGIDDAVADGDVALLGEQLDKVDLIIELSLLKLRRLNMLSERRDFERTLILDTLRRAIYQKHCLLAQSAMPMDDGDHSSYPTDVEMDSILQDSLQKMGLARTLNLHIISGDAREELDEEGVPVIKFPNNGSSKKSSNRHQNASCKQTVQGTITRPMDGPTPVDKPDSKKVRSLFVNYRSILEQYFS
jgi:hypothetical protein